MKKEKKINYRKRRRNLIIGIVIFIFLSMKVFSYVEGLESKKLAEKTFKGKNTEQKEK